ncbi:hypothetical protein NHX12_032885 [Muraenolepis orangiensis]|uniref:trypsin n=1 Tax=Muraenolepis orangiensis TaxID=630683 RepID=A0A9Q0E6K2_9TELE|nr:hypothetical protein NHX12_032885 [Muraenolepis orangiensis]
MTVVLGTSDLSQVNERTMRYNVTKCKHHGYKEVNYKKDIMMLKLSRPSEMEPIPLPNKKTKLKANASCSVAGWGKIKSGGPKVKQLRAVNVFTIDQKACKQQWGTLPANIICAGGFKTEKGACQWLGNIHSEKSTAAFVILFRKDANITVVLGTSDLRRVNERTMRYNVKKCKWE